MDMIISNNLIARENVSKRQLDASNFDTINLPVNTQTEINSFAKSEGELWCNTTKKVLEYFDGVNVREIKKNYVDEYTYEIDFSSTNNVFTDIFAISLPTNREAVYGELDVFAVNATNQVWGAKYTFSAINNAGVVNLVGLSLMTGTLRENFATNLVIQSYVAGNEVRFRGHSGGTQVVDWKLYLKLYKRIWT